MCYGGHQFGNWAGQLGDGRAINLGEVVNQQGDYWAIQLKGAGPTPYSRTADGLAVLRSSIREFVCSEAMYHLGVPTTRALSLINTGEQVMRDVLYDGNPANEPGTVVCRLSPSFVRFGSFQIFASRNEHDELKQLLDVTIEHHFSKLLDDHVAGSKELYLAWLDEVCQRTASMIVEWMRVGRWTKEIDYGEGSAAAPGFPPMPTWFQDNRDFGNIESGLRAVGMNQDEVAGIMGRNWHRFYAKNFTPQAQ